MKTEDRSRLLSFCERACKLEGVYIRARTGPNTRQRETVWRVDDASERFHVAELSNELVTRIDMLAPSDPIWLEVLENGKTNVIDTIRLEPEPERKAADGDALGAAIGALVELAKSAEHRAQASHAAQLQTLDRLVEASFELAETRSALVLAEAMQEESAMGDAIAVLKPLGAAMAAKLMGPKPKALEQQPAPKQTTAPATRPSWSEMPAEELHQTADWLLGNFIALGTARPEAVTSERVGALFAAFADHPAVQEMFTEPDEEPPHA